MRSLGPYLFVGDVPVLVLCGLGGAFRYVLPGE